MKVPNLKETKRQEDSRKCAHNTTKLGYSKEDKELDLSKASKNYPTT